MSEKQRTLNNLRSTLFEVLDEVLDKNQPMEVKRAIAVSQLANQIINSAKVQLQAVNVLGQDSIPSDFLGVEEKKKALPPAAKKAAVYP